MRCFDIYEFFKRVTDLSIAEGMGINLTGKWVKVYLFCCVLRCIHFVHLCCEGADTVIFYDR